MSSKGVALLSDLWDRTTSEILNRMAVRDQNSIVWTPRFVVPENHSSILSDYYRETHVTLRWGTKSRRCDRARGIVAAMPNAPVIKQGYTSASYLLESDEIILPDRKYFSSEEDLYSAVFHELVHSTGHETRLNRASLSICLRTAEMPEPVTAEEEIVTELAAAYLCAHAGILAQTLPSTVAYIHGWAEVLEPENRACPVVDASQAAQEACAYILGHRTR